MSTTSPRDATPPAPAWHTAALVALILAVALSGSLLRSRVAETLPRVATGSRVIAVYVPMIVVQWSLALYVCRVGRERNALLSLIGRRWSSSRRAFVDVTLALVGLILLATFELTWTRAFGASSGPITALLPHSVSERLAWTAVAVSVGFCEELVFRGYLQTQLAAFTGRAFVGIVLQAALFGCAHAEQGGASVLRFGLYGIAFGMLARWRRSLIPGILCHVASDVIAGLGPTS